MAVIKFQIHVSTKIDHSQRPLCFWMKDNVLFVKLGIFSYALASAKKVVVINIPRLMGISILGNKFKGVIKRVENIVAITTAVNNMNPKTVCNK